MDINIGSKTFKNVETFPIGKLEHLRQLAEIQVTNYKRVIQNYPPDRMERCGKPFLNKLEAEVEKIKTLLKTKQRE